MDLISVIVPVYKVEKYLDRCVQSIVDQTYSNLEIILVDDGSPDHCPAMCDAWAAKDSRIRVIHKENGGGAQARNVGLDCATGQYIAFADSDDYVLPGMYATLYELLCEHGADIAECSFHMVETDEMPARDTIVDKVCIYNTEEALNENIRDKVCRQLVWNKLYTQNVIRNVRFVENKFIDDEFFTYRVLGNAQKVVVSQLRLYCYRQQSNSAMHQKFSVKWLDAVEAKQCRLEYIQQHHPTLESAARISLRYTSLYMGQMALLYMGHEESIAAFERLIAVQKQHPLTQEDKKKMSPKQRIWAVLSEWSFKETCKLRNLLKIGI